MPRTGVCAPWPKRWASAIRACSASGPNTLSSRISSKVSEKPGIINAYEFGAPVIAAGQKACSLGRRSPPRKPLVLMQQQQSENARIPPNITAGTKEFGQMPEPRCFDEMTLWDGAIRPVYAKIANWLAAAPPALLASRRLQAELLFRRIGITFAVYGEGEKEGAERLIPFDIIPRLMLRSEWPRLEAGLVQRVKALNHFLADIYGAQEIVKAGRIPAGLVARNAEFRPEMADF